MSQLVGDAPARDVTRRTRARRSVRGISLTALGLAVTSAAAWYAVSWWTVGRFIETTDDAYVGGDVTVVAPRISGAIALVAVEDNQPVKAGDLLVKLDDRDLLATLARADAAVSAQQATLANLEARTALQQEVISQGRADVAAAEAEVERTDLDRRRYQRLSANNDASIQTFQRADADAKKAVAADRRARAALMAAIRQVAVLDTERRQTEAALAGARADRDLASLTAGYAEVRSPIDGTVGNRSARAGSYVAAGAQLLAIVPSQGLWVDANFKETQLGALRRNMRARIEADAERGANFSGRVVSVSPATGAQFSVIPPENATGNFTKIVQRVPVRIMLEGDGSTLGALRPGLSVTASIDTRSDTSR